MKSSIWLYIFLSFVIVGANAEDSDKIEFIGNISDKYYNIKDPIFAILPFEIQEEWSGWKVSKQEKDSYKDLICIRNYERFQLLMSTFGFNIVERLKLESAIEEQELSLNQNSQVLKIGNIVSSNIIISSLIVRWINYSKIGSETGFGMYEIIIKGFSVETGEILFVLNASSKFKTTYDSFRVDILDIEDKALKRIIKELIRV